MTWSACLVALALGLSFGASACMLSCIPTLGVALLAEEGGALATGRLAARFNAGRWLGYSLLGGVSGGIGASITQGLNPRHAAWLFGAVLILAGASLWRRSRASACARHVASDWFRGNLFGMGLGMSLTPCVPLGAVCASAAASGVAWKGALLGAMFGLGAVIPAQLVLGYGLGAAGQQLRMQLSRRAPVLNRLASIVLLGLGLGTFAGVLRL